MSEFCGNGDGLVLNGNLASDIARYIGQTVTIFTTSGGMSGSGFTGVVLGVNDCFVKLLTQIGPRPDVQSEIHVTEITTQLLV